MILNRFLSVLAAFMCLGLLFQVPVAHAQHPGFGDPGARAAGGSTAGLVPVEPSVDGGAIPMGGTAQVVILFRNEGGQPVETGLIRLYPSSTVTADVSLNQCQVEPLPPAAECAVALSVKGVQAGAWRVDMLMSHSGRARLVTASVSGTIEASGEDAETLSSDIEAVPDELDFGSLSTSQGLVESVILRNTTANPITMSKVYIDAAAQAGYSLKTECETLAPGQACMATVSWSPKLQGRSSGVLVVEHSGPAALTSVALRGEYAPDLAAEAEVFPEAVPGKGLLVSSQKEITFGDEVATVSTMTISLVNAGDAALEIEDVSISGEDNGLSFKGAGCTAGTVLEPVEACPLTVKWSPARSGPLFDDVQVSHDGARGILVLPIRGEASAAVSQDQQAIVLSDYATALPVVSGGDSVDSDLSSKPPSRPVLPSVVNPKTVLDGYKITSFSPTRAIINGPGGSRIVFDDEEVVLGGVPWFVTIQKNGIEFLHRGQRVLLLFDRSLSSSLSSGSSSTSSTASTGEN